MFEGREIEREKLKREVGGVVGTVKIGSVVICVHFAHKTKVVICIEKISLMGHLWLLTKRNII